MEGAVFIGIDSGTQGVKVLALEEGSGRIITQAAAPHQLISGENGRREQEPQWWLTALQQALAQVLASAEVDASKVVALGVSGQQHGCVTLDASGSVIRPAKLWCDTETAPEAEQLTALLGGPERVVELTGNGIAAGFTASKVLWLKLHEPENYARLAMLLLPHDYINHWLTGELTTECGDASGTAYFDVRQCRWSEEVLLALDESGRLQLCLPRLLAADEPAGRLRPEVAHSLGLPPGVIVSAGGGDNMLAAIGTGNVQPGVVTASLGTSGTIYACASQPVVDPQGELAAFCDSTGQWLPLVCTMNVTVCTELVRSMFQLDLAAFTTEAAQAPASAGGVLLAPFFNGERTPALPTATACYAGLSATNCTRRNMCRAAVEGPALSLRYGLDVLRRVGLVPAEIRLTGGGAQNALWRQVVADAFGLPVVCPACGEAGALGAALQAMWCWMRQQGSDVTIQQLAAQHVQLDQATRCEPLPANEAVYADSYQRYQGLVDALRPYWQAC